MNEFADINGKFKMLMQAARVERSERAVTQCLIVAGAYAAEITPIATSNLINSQYREVRITNSGVTGEIGYGANYAQYVHDAPGKLLGLNVPRHPITDGIVWGPNGKPKFLSEGVLQMARDDMKSIMRENFLI